MDDLAHDDGVGRLQSSVTEEKARANRGLFLTAVTTSAGRTGIYFLFGLILGVAVALLQAAFEAGPACRR